MSFNDYIYWQTLQKTGKTPEEIYEYEHPKVVRCKECRHRNERCGMGEHRWCEMLNMSTTPDDYCSYGERGDE